MICVTTKVSETSLVLLIFSKNAVCHVISCSFTAKCLALTLSKPAPWELHGLVKGLRFVLLIQEKKKMPLDIAILEKHCLNH